MALSVLDQLAVRTLDEQQRARGLRLIESWRADLARCSSRCRANFRHEFWRSRGSKHTARIYLATARERYESWGAVRMLRELDAR